MRMTNSEHDKELSDYQKREELREREHSKIPVPDYAMATLDDFINEAESHLAIDMVDYKDMPREIQYAYLYGFIKNTLSGFIDWRDRSKT